MLNIARHTSGCQRQSLKTYHAENSNKSARHIWGLKRTSADRKLRPHHVNRPLQADLGTEPTLRMRQSVNYVWSTLRMRHNLAANSYLYCECAMLVTSAVARYR